MRKHQILKSRMVSGKRAVAAALSVALFFSVVSVNASREEIQAADTGSLSRYSIEGYAAAGNVTGGGVLAQSNENYYEVSNASGFLKALTAVKKSGKPSVIEVTKDLALGSIEIGTALTTYKNVVSAASKQPLLHPTLVKTGVSMIDLKEMENLTIFSSNGSKITHACLNISKSKNIIIRNLVFDEIWEWDENTNGNYDRNDWDYITMQNKTTGVWIDHCTFYKAYDGIIDVKKADLNQTSDVTISYSQFLPGSEGSFFEDMMKLLESAPKKYSYYNSLITTYGMTTEQVRGYAYAQKKTHLIGASDSEANMKNLRITLANNYYKNSMDRMPRIRAGYAYIYNCIMDSSELYTLRSSIKNSTAKSKVVSNGVVSTCGAQALLQNCNVDGIINMLLSGNGNSSAGFVGALNSVYTLNGKGTALTVTDKTGEGLKLNTQSFLRKLPFDAVILYDASSLEKTVLPYTGSGAVKMTNTQWMQTVYENNVEIPETSPSVAPEASPSVSPSAAPEASPSVSPSATPEASPSTAPAASQLHNFTTDGLSSSFYQFTGSLSSSKGTVVYGKLKLTAALKMESSTSITFTSKNTAEFTLIANESCNKAVLIDGKEYAFHNGKLTVSLKAGKHTVKKADSNVNLYYITLQ